MLLIVAFVFSGEEFVALEPFGFRDDLHVNARTQRILFLFVLLLLGLIGFVVIRVIVFLFFVTLPSRGFLLGDDGLERVKSFSCRRASCLTNQMLNTCIPIWKVIVVNSLALTSFFPK